MDLQKEISDMRQTLSRIEERVNAALDALDDHEARLRSLENRSARRWESLISECIKLAVAAVAGYIAARLL